MSTPSPPQEERVEKAWPFFGYAPGNYMARCMGCGETFSDLDKRALRCLECAVKASKSEIDRLTHHIKPTEAIALRRVGDFAVVSLLLADGREVELIREYAEGCFSHIIEPSGIAKAIRRERGFDELLGDRTP